MYKLLAALFCTILSITSVAQVADGSISPDWTMTDINGSSHNLYDLLDEGYTVILDFSTTWCPSCWNYHTSGALKTVWEEHGPDGTNDVFVIFLEADNNTGMADLQGNTPGSKGDYITGTPYPIIDNAYDLAQSYQIQFYPTILSICPSRQVHSVGSYPASTLYNIAMDNCPSNDLNTDAAILTMPGHDYFCSGDNYVPRVSIQNLSASGNVMTSASFSTYIDETLDNTYVWNGSLGLYDSEEIQLPALNGLSGTTEVSVLMSFNGDLDDSNNSISTELEIAPQAQQEIQLNIITDQAGDETTWELKDDMGAVILEGGNYQSLSEYNETILVPNDGCYTFKISDGGNNGMCCQNGSGSYTLRDINNQIIATGGEFERSESSEFNVAGVSSISEINEIDFKVYPIPARDILNISAIKDHSNIDVSIVDNLGRVVERIQINGQGPSQVDVSKLNPGVYSLLLRSEDMLGNTLFVVK